MKNKDSLKNTVEGVKLSNKIKCTVCHKECGVRPDVLLARMERFKGSVKERYDQLIASYTCRSCRKEKGVDGIGTVVLATSGATGTVFDANSAFWREPGYQFPSGNITKPLDMGYVQALTIDTCLMPNYILDEKCQECPFYKNCSYTKKRAGKITEVKRRGRPRKDA